MKKNLSVLILSSLVLVSCGKSDPNNDPNNLDITPDTEIQNSAQAQVVCAPFIKYLECSLEKASEARKEIHQKILDETLQKINTDAPERIAQQCDTYIKVLKENPDVAFKNGCTLEESTTPETTPEAAA